MKSKLIAVILSWSLVFGLFPFAGISYGYAQESVDPSAAETIATDEESVPTGTTEGASGYEQSSSETATDGATPTDDSEKSDSTIVIDEGAEGDPIPSESGVDEQTQPDNNQDALPSSDVSDDSESDDSLDDSDESAAGSDDVDVPIVYVEGTSENDGDIALRAQAAKGWKRLWGANAYDTMQAVLQESDVFPDKRGGSVVLATGEGYWDALSASGLAGLLDAPIIITRGASLCDQAKSELARLEPSNVYIMGGYAAISEQAEADILAILPEASVERVAGQTAVYTAIEAYNSVSGWGTTAIIACSNGYWDALSAAPYAFSQHAPLFLANSSDNSNYRTLSPEVLQCIEHGSFARVVIVGGTEAVSSDVETQLGSIGFTGASVVRIAGKDAIDTSALFAKWELSEGMTLSNLTLATSNGYWDALSSSSLCGSLNSVLVLVGKNGDYRALDAVYDYGGSDVDCGYIIGGEAAIPKFAESRITAPWTLTAFNVPNYVRKGTSFTVDVSGSAIPADTVFSWSWQNTSTNGSGNWGSAGTSPTLTCSFADAGSYKITVSALAPDDTSSEMSASVYAYGLEGLSIKSSSNGNYVASPNMGVDASKLSGVQYRYTWSHASSGKKGTLKDWSSSTKVSFSATGLGSMSGTYKITVEAKDANGSLGSVSSNIQLDAMTVKAQSFYSPTGYLILVDCYNNWVGVYQGKQGSWTRIRHMRCTTGAPETPTVKGTFSVTGKGYVFGSGYSCYYYTQFYGDYLFHSVIYEQGTFVIRDGRLGMSLSLGCVRLQISDAKWIYDNIPYYTTVHTYI